MSKTQLTKPTVPFAEAPWHHGLPSPYYKESHYRLREWTKKWTKTHLMPVAMKWDEAGEVDPKVYAQAAKDGILIPVALGTKIDQKYLDMAGGIKLPAGVEASEWDAFHDFILMDELNRTGANGPVMGIFAGLQYGCPPVKDFANSTLRDAILPSLLNGSKRIALAVTEPQAGSNVANLSASAVKSPDGKHYIVNGTKKWITNGIWSNYLTTAVRTSGKAGDLRGISLLLIPTDTVNMRKMKMQGAWSSGTTFVEFDDVKVPVENLIGEEGSGFKYIMYNFNHERMTIVYACLRQSRCCLEDSVAHVQRREVFGQKLIENAVVRNKIAHMARQVEALQSWTESVVYQQNSMSKEQSNKLTGGTTALLKAHAGLTLEYVCREAVQLLGGMGLTRGGTGERIERIWREVKALTIPGGSEDVLLDLGVRQQLKLVNAQSKL